MKTTVFVGTSLDGFIARTDSALDWRPASLRPELRSTRHFPSGLAQSEYEVAAG